MPPVAAALISAPWCLPVVAHVEGVDVDGLACVSERWACERLRGNVERFGTLAGIVSVGECEER